MESAPKALSGNEQLELLRKSRENGDNELKNIVIETSMRLVYHIVKKFTGDIISYDDLVGIGSVGLIKAASSFDPYRGVKFATYAGRCIENEILMELRHCRKISSEISLEEPVCIDGDGEELYLKDVIFGDLNTEEEAEKEERRAFISRSRMRQAGLKKRDIIVLCLRYGLTTGKTRTQREVALRLGISRSYASRIEKKSIAKLKKKYEALID